MTKANYTVADDVKILRGVVGREMHAQASAALDRIEARGEPLKPKAERVWIHRCGWVGIGDDAPTECGHCVSPGKWDRLYSL